MPDLPDDTVVAIFGDGTKFTMGDFRKIYAALPPANQQMALRNREQWLHQWELLRKLTKMAEEAKLDQESPYKETLAYGRMNVLATRPDQRRDQPGRGGTRRYHQVLRFQ